MEGANGGGDGWNGRQDTFLPSLEGTCLCEYYDDFYCRLEINGQKVLTASAQIPPQKKIICHNTAKPNTSTGLMGHVVQIILPESCLLNI